MFLTSFFRSYEHHTILASLSITTDQIFVGIRRENSYSLNIIRINYRFSFLLWSGYFDIIDKPEWWTICSFKEGIRGWCRWNTIANLTTAYKTEAKANYQQDQNLSFHTINC